MCWVILVFVWLGEGGPSSWDDPPSRCLLLDALGVEVGGESMCDRVLHQIPLKQCCQCLREAGFARFVVAVGSLHDKCHLRYGRLVLGVNLEPNTQKVLDSLLDVFLYGEDIHWDDRHKEIIFFDDLEGGLFTVYVYSYFHCFCYLRMNSEL
jgi:hypothetical protein